MGSNEDVRQRIRRARTIWGRVEVCLRESRLTRKWKARIVEATFGSSLVYDCQERVWWKRDLNSLQRWIDKCSRYI